MNTSFIRIEVKNDLRIVYFREDGSSVIFLKGDRAWRNNNPGNIAYGNGKLAKELGAIGKAGGFAVFPSYEIGRKAMFTVLKKTDFQERTLAKTIEVWAPAKDRNDTETYKKQIQAWTKIDLNRILRSLSEKELELLVSAIQRREGDRPGKIIEIPADEQQTAPN